MTQSLQTTGQHQGYHDHQLFTARKEGEKGGERELMDEVSQTSGFSVKANSDQPVELEMIIVSSFFSFLHRLFQWFEFKNI